MTGSGVVALLLLPPIVRPGREQESNWIRTNIYQGALLPGLDGARARQPAEAPEMYSTFYC
jgi:hypothetical protein